MGARAMTASLTPHKNRNRSGVPSYRTALIRPPVTAVILRIRAQIYSRTGILDARKGLDKCEHIIHIHEPVDLYAVQEGVNVGNRHVRGIESARVLKRLDGRHGVVETRRTVGRRPLCTAEEPNRVAKPLDARLQLRLPNRRL